MTEQNDGLEAYEPTVMRPMARRNRRWSSWQRSRLYAILVPFALITQLVSAATSRTNRALHIYLAVAFGWSCVTVLFRQRKPVSPAARPPAYMTWTAQRWWIGLAFVGALVTMILASVAYAHRPLDQAIVLVVGTVLGTAAMWLVRFLARRRYAG